MGLAAVSSLSILTGIAAVLVWGGISFLLLLVLVTALICAVYMKYIIRVFEEEPLLLPPRLEAPSDAEDVRVPTSDGLWLQGAWLCARTPESHGVVIFCHGFKMDRWAALAYCDSLRDVGLDVFTFDFRNHGDSDALEGYRPMQWVTEYEVRDVLAAIQHARARQQDRGLPERFLLMGVSRGGGAALVAASREPSVSVLITDGAFPTHSMQLHFMLRWVGIFANIPTIYRRIPKWYYGLLCTIARWVTAWRNRCWFPSIERAARKLQVRFWLCIHGGEDSYIPPEVARALCARANCPHEFWLVPDARHNEAHRLAPDEYVSKLREVASRMFAEEEVPLSERAR